MISGIYIIQNVTNRKVYIGQAQDIESRRKRHFGLLRAGTHRNIHLQRAFDRDGENSFDFDIVEICDKPRLTSSEQKWIDSYSPDEIYNICLVAESSTGVKRRDETRKKLSAVKKGRIPHHLFAPDVRARAHATFKDGWHSHADRNTSAVVDKRSQSLRKRWREQPRKPPSAETRARMSASAIRRHAEKPMPREAIERANQSRRARRVSVCV